MSHALTLRPWSASVQSYSMMGNPAYLFFSWECTVISRMVCISPSSSCTFSIRGIIFPVLVNQHWQPTLLCDPRILSVSDSKEFAPIPNAISDPSCNSIVINIRSCFKREYLLMERFGGFDIALIGRPFSAMMGCVKGCPEGGDVMMRKEGRDKR